MSQIWTPDNQIPEVRSVTHGGTALDRWLLSDETYTPSHGSRTSADIRITPDTALASTVVLASCRLLAETIASLPLQIMRRTKDGGAVPAPESPLYKVLSFMPNEWQTKFEFFEQMVMNLTLWGNAYCRIRSGRYGSVSALDNLHPSNMIVERLINGRLRYTYTDPFTGQMEKFLQEDVLHIRWTPEPDGIKGMVPVEVAREAIALARACEIHAAKYWANSARPGVVLKTEQQLSPDAATLLRDNWERIHRGADKAYRTCILTNGLEPVPIGFDAQQSQFMDARRFQTEEITRVYRLPIALIQGESVGNLEAIGRQFVTYTLVPWLNRIEGGISRSLIWNDDLFYAEFDTKALMRADPNSRAGFYSTMQGLGIYSINDSRREEGLPPIEHGDKHFVAMNLTPLEEAVKGPQPQGGPGMAPPAIPGGPPSLPGVKPGEAPPAGAEGKQSQPATDLKPGDAASLPDGSVVEIKEFVASKKSAIVVDHDGKEQMVKISDLQPPPKEEEAAEERALSKQSEALKSSQMQIAREHGRWTQRDAQYKNSGDECRSCVFFEGEGTCEIVKGLISPTGSCRLSIIPTEKIVESRDCGRQEGGRFGENNKCQADSGGGSGGYRPKTLADERLDAADEDTVDAAAANSPYDGGTNGGFMPDRVYEVDLPGVGRVPVNVDDNREIVEYVTLLAKSAKKSVQDYMAENGLRGDINNLAPESKAKLFGTKPGSFKQRLPTTWPAADEKVARHAASVMRAARINPADLKKAIRVVAKKTGKLSSDLAYSGLKIFKKDRREFLAWARDTIDFSRDRRSEENDDIEHRADDGCGRTEGGKFGPKNQCQDDGKGGGAEPAKKQRNTEVLDIQKVLDKIASNPDGFTIDPVSAESPPDGIMVSEFPNEDGRSLQVAAKEITSDEAKKSVSTWIAKNIDVLADTNRFVGGWLSDGKFYLDVATRYEPDQAEAALDSARKHEQHAVFNLKTKKATWVKFEGERPAGWDSGYRKARKDAAVDDLNDNDDWTNLDELEKHGKKTVRSLKRKKKNGRPEGTEVRHSGVGQDEARNLSGDESVLRGEGQGEGPRIGPVLVQRRTGRPSRTVRQLVAEARDILGDMMPEVSYRDISPALAVYDDEKNVLYVNPTKCRRLSLTSQPNPILHEAAHAVHIAEAADTYLSPPTLTPEQRSLATTKVSRAAAEGAREFVAEVIAGSLVGIEFSPEVIETFKELAGRDIRRL